VGTEKSESGEAPATMELIRGGGVATPAGFTAGGIHVGVRTDWDKLDVGIVASAAPCVAAATYTQNRVPGASLIISKQHLSNARAQAIVANAGCANAATGQQGIDDAITMARLTAKKLGIDPHDVVVASTGVIGTYLPMDRIASGIEQVALTEAGGLDFATAIMTTDTVPKHVAVRCGRGWTIGGVVKGVGMIHPNMATMLCFITTDAAVESAFLAASLKKSVDVSFNMIDVDSDTSPDDIALVMANGLAGGAPIRDGHPDAGAFDKALELVCITLARKMVADAEGSTKVIQATVEGAASVDDARKAAREIIRSVGVKTAIYGEDANWGRVLSAVGNSGAMVAEEKVALYFQGPDGKEVCVFHGAPLEYDAAEAKSCLAPAEVRIRVQMGLGDGVATAWGSDLTEEFVRLNSVYTT